MLSDVFQFFFAFLGENPIPVFVFLYESGVDDFGVAVGPEFVFGVMLEAEEFVDCVFVPFDEILSPQTRYFNAGLGRPLQLYIW